MGRDAGRRGTRRRRVDDDDLVARVDAVPERDEAPVEQAGAIATGNDDTQHDERLVVTGEQRCGATITRLPQLSVVIATRNRSDRLAGAVRSVLEQTERDLE